jgi:hypothetical protein
MVKRLRENMVPNLLPPVLEEEPVKFSAASPGKQAAAAALGAVNLGGVLYLRYTYIISCIISCVK